MSDYKVLVSDKVSETGLDILRKAEGIFVDVKTDLTTEELKYSIGEYDALVVRSSTKVTAEVIEAADRLRVIGRAGIGVDNVDVPAATRKGIVVMNTPQGNAIAAAEHTISMMCALARNIPQATAALKSGDWDRGRFMGVEMSGKVLGLVGIGNIGSIVAQRAQGGGIINEKALYQALKSGKIAGAALDCFELEPAVGNPLFEFDRVICTPHLGASTDEAQENVAIAIAEQLIDYLTNGVLQNTVNVPSVSLEMLPQLMPFSDLAERLGRFGAQLFNSAIETVAIEYVGEVTRFSLPPLKAAALKGLLHPHMGDIVNFVNAPLMAEERGITVTEQSTTKAEDYASLISISASSKKESHSVTGSLFGRKEPRLLELDNCPLGGGLAGHLLLVRNEDQPGVIGNIGTILGKHNINIASIKVGRDKEGETGMTLLRLDIPVSQTLIDEMSKFPHVRSVKQLELP